MSFRARFALNLGVSLVYILVFAPLYDLVSRAAIALSIVPIVVAANTFGVRGGFAAGLVSVPINGALIALLDKDDPGHAACVNAAKYLPAVPLLTTWPCFTEAMYLLGEVGGYRYQAELWKIQTLQRLVLPRLWHFRLTLE